ncbi:MAG: prepilin-type N-terminal cleavage/methylation domain-containing protein [Planctomycetes bacterium]|nr:prepilin-type N-terminal cleavage/methylation domain-containing protein [Planctomycetota bacterium]
MKALATIERARRPRRGGGFTLIEAVSVMVILAILAAAAVPAISNFTDSRASAAGHMLLHDVTFARQHAVATGTITWVKFDAAAETWTLQAETGAAGKANAVTMTDVATNANYVKTLMTGDFPDVQVVSAVFDGGADIGFDWLGAPLTGDATTLAADGTVTLTSSVTLTVEKGTGHAVFAAP